MNRLLLLLVGCMCAVGKVGASDKIEDYIYVFIWNSDGTNSVYKCAERPAIIPTKDCLLLRVNGTEIQYPINEFRKFSFGKAEDVAHPAALSGSNLRNIGAEGHPYGWNNGTDFV